MGKRIKRKIQILLRFVRQVVKGVACHAMFTTYDYPIGLKAIYLTFLNNIQKKPATKNLLFPQLAYIGSYINGIRDKFRLFRFLNRFLFSEGKINCS